MEWGGGIAFRRVYPAQAYATVVVLVRLDIKMYLIGLFDRFKYPRIETVAIASTDCIRMTEDDL